MSELRRDESVVGACLEEHALNEQAVRFAIGLEIDSPDHLLIDEWAGRAAAQRRGLHVIGTLGVLVQAAEQNLLDLKQTFDKLAKTTFRADQKLFDQLLADSTIRKSLP